MRGIDPCGADDDGCLGIGKDCLFACKFMIAIVRKAKLKWFALYCVLAGIACLIMNICA